MKYVAVMLMTGWCGLFAAEAALREFHDQQGRTVKIELLSWNKASGKLSVEMENGRRISVKPSIFSEKDQQYIADWLQDQVFMNDRYLRLDVEKRSAGQRKETKEIQSNQNSEDEVKINIDKVVYELTLENKGHTDLVNCTVEYMLFYEKEEFGSNADPALKYEAGKKMLEELKCGDSANVVTKPAEMTTYKLPPGWVWTNGASTKSRDQVLGLWVKITRKSADGRTLVREYCEPGSLKEKHRWEPTPVSKKKKRPAGR
jgi:hypothetical protein